MNAEDPSHRILLVDDDAPFRERLALSLARRGFETRTSGDVGNALAEADKFRPNAILVDLRIGTESGLALVPALRRILPQARIVMLTGYGSIASAMEAVRHGASDYLTKPADIDEMFSAKPLMMK